jgi:hypothetical protein
MKNSNDTIGNRSRDLPVCSAVPQPLRLRLQSADSLFYPARDQNLTVNRRDGAGLSDCITSHFRTHKRSVPLTRQTKSYFQEAKDPVGGGRCPGLLDGNMERLRKNKK